MEARPALVLTACLLIYPLGAGASDCPIPFPSKTQSVTAYGPRAGGYCDGQVEAPHGGALQVVAIRFHDGSRKAIGTPFSIDVAVEAGRRKGNLVIQGLPLDATVNYRFDANLGFTELPLEVGADAALWQLQGLTPDKIGWVAWTQEPGKERLYVPVGSGGGSSRVEVTLRAAVELALLRVTIEAPDRQYQQEVPKSIAPGEPITFDLVEGPRGLLTITFVADGADGISSQSGSILLWRPFP